MFFLNQNQATILKIMMASLAGKHNQDGWMFFSCFVCLFENKLFLKKQNRNNGFNKRGIFEETKKSLLKVNLFFCMFWIIIFTFFSSQYSQEEQQQKHSFLFFSYIDPNWSKVEIVVIYRVFLKEKNLIETSLSYLDFKSLQVYA